MSKALRLRNFCFTINNYREEHILNLKELQSTGFFEYVIYGIECGESGTPHLQGYAELSKQQRRNIVCERMPGAHIEARMGTQDQAINYCKKERNFTEYGTRNKQGSRTDIATIRELAISEGMRAVCKRPDVSLNDLKFAEKVLTYDESPRDWEVKVYWYYGPTGVGKSYRARTLARELGYETSDIYTKNDANKWWDGYDRHSYVILDDFRDSWWELTEMLSLLDRYEKRIQFKGGYRQFVPKCIVVTSCKPPKEMYPNTGEAVAQLLRRVNVIENLGPSVDPFSLIRYSGEGITTIHPAYGSTEQSSLVSGIPSSLSSSVPPMFSDLTITPELEYVPTLDLSFVY